MNALFREFLYLPRWERRGVLMLIALIGTMFVAGHYYRARRQAWLALQTDSLQTEAAGSRYRAFVASVEAKRPARRERGGSHAMETASHKPAVVTLAPFNPNRADSLTFRRLGLPAWMAHNILRYRVKGGRFRTAADFKKMYGLTDEQYANLLPYIRIAPEEARRTTRQSVVSSASDSSASIVPRFVQSVKYPAGTQINLNDVDTTELKKIPGIGSVTARRIVGYRNRLGGFYAVSQLGDLSLNVDSLQTWFTVSGDSICRINLNRVGVERLCAHPYINFYQAKVFVEYRQKHGKLKSLKPFALYEEFTPEDLQRIGQYVCFE
ncbi:MAG: helix-hairpin-helix domain-containing protein [Mediterranea sp.]|jgi:DNA uptake protein ComE-like DNA-binding protein|nr:helix-hairpin-helix domain-containing protein [Mediterranea sp.]